MRGLAVDMSAGYGTALWNQLEMRRAFLIPVLRLAFTLLNVVRSADSAPLGRWAVGLT